MSHVDYPLWARYVHDLLMRHAPHTRDVLELGCGTGSFALALMKLSNYRYLATDRAEEMLEVARSKADREGAEIRFRKMDFLDFDLNQQFDAVVIGIIDGHTEEMTFNPLPTSRIEAGDILIVLGDQDIIHALREKVCTP